MSVRSVKLWRGKTPDAPVPPRVRARVFERKNGRCHKCGRKIEVGDKWVLEHMIAICNGGENAEDNLDVTCGWCLPEKNAEDAKIKKHVTKVRYSHMGIKSNTDRKLQGRGFAKSGMKYSRAQGKMVPRT